MSIGAGSTAGNAAPIGDAEVGPIELALNDGCEVGISEGELGDGARDGIGCSIELGTDWAGVGCSEDGSDWNAEGQNVGLIVAAALLGSLDGGSLISAATDGTRLEYVKLGTDDESIRTSDGFVVCSATEGIELSELVGVSDGLGADGTVLG